MDIESSKFAILIKIDPRKLHIQNEFCQYNYVFVKPIIEKVKFLTIFILIG